MMSFQVPGAKLRDCASGPVRLLAVLGCATALAGCSVTKYEVTGATPTDYRDRHPIAIKEAPQTLDLFIGSNRGSLTGTQRAQVLGFVSSWRREATGGILIDVPSGTSNGHASASAVQEVRSLLAGAGVPPQSMELRPYQPVHPGKLATLKLSYPRIAATAGPCGLWPDDLGPTYQRQHAENGQYWNFGCAHQRNLAAMVENPADLVQPRSETPSYTGRRTTVLDKFHRGESTATTYTDPNKGKISDVGQ